MHSKKISVVILAGGKATRMGEICEVTPKCLIPFSNIPFLEYLVMWLSSQEIVDDIVISIGHLSRSIEAIFRHPKWHKVKLVREEYPLGTGGGLRKATDYTNQETIFVCNADTVVDLPLQDITYRFMSQRYLAMSVVSQSTDVPNPEAVIIGENGMVVDFLEGPRVLEQPVTKFVYRGSSTGCYLLRKACVVKLIPQNTFYSLEQEFIPQLVTRSILFTFSIGNKFLWDFGTPDRIAVMYRNQDVLQRIYSIALTQREIQVLTKSYYML
ncbi:NTP transferase domain-containing protein [bacterium]|uniref:MobA-like NTP transferase domain-containing protein n=1 Tax=candidate division WWE3 bacterium CG22_combo_CG10-13_8_21_14_all_39_12 TaxID=1975094 RepID=A0A2H0BG98_UNCKA|nr:NTP transferase domain-containing protein [bacterium]PIP56685.1 MAG: hypothetical protein COX05_01790 [candidate division WWE3 bacterium CG22_combo_CG10-13_8_21_14_all_39_12]